MVPSAISSPVSPASRSSATPEEILQSLRRQKRRRTHQGPVLSNTPHAGEQAETEPSPSKSRLGGAAWRNGNATQSQRLGSSPGTIGGLVTHQRIATLNSNSTRLTSLRRERSLGVGRERQRAEPASQGNASRIVAHPAPVAQRHQQLTLSNVTSAKSVRARVVKRYRPIVPHSSILTEQQLTEYLEENRLLLSAAKECQASGRLGAAVSYHARLQQNLRWLAGLADSFLSHPRLAEEVKDAVQDPSFT